MNTDETSEQTHTGEPNNELEINESTKFKVWPNLIFTGLLLIIIGLLSYALTTIETPDNNKRQSYLSNNNDVVCAQVTSATIQCENIQTGELKRFELPEKFRDYDGYARGFVTSPDGTKLVIGQQDGVHVVDSDFNEIIKVEEADPNQDFIRYDNYSWADNEWLVYGGDVKQMDGEYDTGDRRNGIYALNILTGEKKLVLEADPSVGLIGANKDYIFVMTEALYNWSAKEAQASPKELYVVRISDGYVRSIDSQQIDYTADGLQVFGPSMNAEYRSDNDVFIFAGMRGTHHFTSDFVIARLEENESGLFLKRVHEDTEHYLGGIFNSVSSLVLTSKGMLFVSRGGALEYPYPLLSDNGNIARLKMIKSETSSTDLFSLKTMPKLPEASSVNPEVSELVTAKEDTPDKVLEFLESLVICSFDDPSMSEYKYYTSVELENRIGVEQLMVFGGCDSPFANYYILENGKYQYVKSSTHGLSCEDRDKAGISPKLVACLEPGEGI